MGRRLGVVAGGFAGAAAGGLCWSGALCCFLVAFVVLGVFVLFAVFVVVSRVGSVGENCGVGLGRLGGVEGGLGWLVVGTSSGLSSPGSSARFLGFPAIGSECKKWGEKRTENEKTLETEKWIMKKAIVPDGELSVISSLGGESVDKC